MTDPIISSSDPETDLGDGTTWLTDVQATNYLHLRLRLEEVYVFTIIVL
jgi:hypothetical protein